MAIDLSRLAQMIKEKRTSSNLTLKEAFKESGVSASTLSRLERNLSQNTEVLIPDTKTLVLLASWLGVSMNNFMEHKVEEGHEGEYLPDVVAAHMRADKKLDKDSAKALTELFRIAYEQTIKNTGEDKDDSNGDSNE